MLQSNHKWEARLAAFTELTKHMIPCLNQDTIRTTPTNTFISIAKKTGFEAIELTWDKVESALANNSLKTLSKEVERQGVAVASINGPENFNLLSPKQFLEVKDRTRKLAQAARELRCNLLAPVPSPMTSRLSEDEVRTQTVESISQMAEVCREDINLGLEFLGMSDCSVSNLKTAMEIVKAVNRKNVGLTLDSFHLYLSGSQLLDAETLGSDRVFIVHVHDSEPGDLRALRDSNRVFPGQGVINLKQLVKDLAKIRYDGFLSLELLKPAYWEEDPEKIAAIGRESLRRVFGI
jgi:2-keto-myo-inositol isomerase